MMMITGKFSVVMIDTTMRVIADIAPSIIAGEPLCVDHVLNSHFPANDRSQPGLSVICKDLRIHRALAFDPSEDDRLAIGVASTVVFDPMQSEEQFVDCDLARSGRLICAGLANVHVQALKITVDGIAVQAIECSARGGIEIKRNRPDTVSSFGCEHCRTANILVLAVITEGELRCLTSVLVMTHLFYGVLWAIESGVRKSIENQKSEKTTEFASTLGLL